MNIIFRDGAYIPVTAETKLENIDYNSIIGRYSVKIEDGLVNIKPITNPVLILNRDIYWTGDHYIIYQGDQILLNIGAKIYNHSNIDFKQEDFRLNDIELEGFSPNYSTFEIYNIDIASNSIISTNIFEENYEVQFKNIIYDNIENPSPLCYGGLIFKTKQSIPKGNITIMGLLARNLSISHIDTIPINETAYIKIFHNPYIKAAIKKSKSQNLENIKLILENLSDINQELTVVLELENTRVIDYEGDMEFIEGKLYREIILPPRTRKELEGEIVF